MVCYRCNRDDCIHKTTFSWESSWVARPYSGYWGQSDDQDGWDHFPPKNYILLMKKGKKHEQIMDDYREREVF